MNLSENETLIQEAVSLAEAWQKRANELLTSRERKYQKQMMRLIRNPLDKVILTKMIDQSFRADNPGRVADQVNFVLKKYGVPGFFSMSEHALMRLFLSVGRHAPSISIPRMIAKIREDSARSVIPGEPEVLFPHLQKRREQGVRMNLNHIGEAVMGEKEAVSRLEQYLADLRNPEIEYISVKISTLYSQISSLAFAHTIEVLMERLAQLFRTARDHHFVRKDNTVVPKFVNLDMEEYRDLEITAALFTRTLDLEEFKDYPAGIVLQAYLPDSYQMQRDLTDWAKKRVADGGAPIKIRIVKGANMEMEAVESAVYNWPLAPYDNKLAVDANFKRMVDYAMIPENIQAVHMGIASHNLFEQAYAYKLARENGVAEYSSFEMLEGMADHIWRAVKDVSGESVLLYAPVADRDEFINAIAYLIRRLDENTAEENFLRYSFNLTPDSEEWNFLKRTFIESCRYKDQAKKTPNRIQDRRNESFPEKMSPFYTDRFANEPDTDWSLTANRKWAESIRDAWKKGAGQGPDEIPVVVAGEEIFQGRDTVDVPDPNRIHENIIVARFALADKADAQRAVETAKADPDGWRKMTHAERHEILSRAAMELRKARGDLIGAAAANTGKVFTEADPEVSEAIDFTEFYPWTVRKFDELKTVTPHPKGAALVITPWNFPIAIPTGGITASLAAGNTVIFKPATAAAMTAWHLCQCFWRAGISKNVLQFVPCSGSKVGPELTRHPDIDYIILTGGTDTGMEILKARPNVLLAAETGGKNATIVTAMSDRDQAIKHILHSAFSNCGQKCSATSLVILEREVYEDPHFREQFVDAAKSCAVGSAWEFRNKIAPLIHPPKGDLLKGLTELEAGEEWALKPENVHDNPYMWTPGIKWNVQPGSYTHMTEFFGPVVGVMCAEDLDHAIHLVNQTGYGLTSGLESLDQREQEKWKQGLEAGNLYINRVTTGAVVLRQPFGGMKKSALGAGIKAGSPNYVSQFMDFEETDLPAVGAIEKEYALLRTAQDWRLKLQWGQLSEYAADLRKTVRAIESYICNAEQEFYLEKDYFHLRGQDNVMRYLPVGTVLVRVHPEDTLFDVLGRIAAATVARCRLIVGIPKDLNNPVTEFLSGEEGKRILRGTRLTRHSDAELIDILPDIDRIRYAAPDRVPTAVYEAAAKAGFHIARNPVLMEGRIEMLHYFQEQSISHDYHRYGNLGDRTILE
ncbi:MAG: bifunctional proline dehydrogenase/L-glutamate gamma-semialdehyde dehydrogenase [Thermodesulfobacteriota bacterium]